ncbi:hypothetical protein [Erythrobacter litoralis]|uniref:Uncharacterized protein n=1 Tax=Erythrobacter litoralis (strain HTCC2594) TaxID=314225 RepID=Q2N7I8_ERYLH|nr:hypothetical protein [Erythrobacter litoralis]ABC64353.1 hypothetical protein ELI_11305 [Erythrobacter litoralis HTCC2594]
MMRRGAALAGLSSLLVSAATLSAQSSAPEAGTYRGKCEYADRLVPFLGQGYTFWLCDELLVERKGDEGRFVFRSRDGRPAAFTGTWNEHALTVRHLRLGTQPALEVKGECKVFRATDRVAAVTCIVDRRGRGWAANFVPGDG